jgi:hypothetical protein
MTATPMSSPESKRAKGLRSPRGLKKRQLSPDQDVKNVSYGDPTAHGLSQLSDIVSLETQPASAPALTSSLANAECRADAEGLTQPQVRAHGPAQPSTHPVTALSRHGVGRKGSLWIPMEAFDSEW